MNTEISNGWHLILKWVAVITMLIGSTTYFLSDVLTWNNVILSIGNLLGSLSLPIYSFLLVEGFFKTNNRKKHLLSIMILAIVTEIPFDMMICVQPFDLTNQNIAFTLAVAYILMMYCEKDHKGYLEKNIIPTIKCRLAQSDVVIKASVMAIRVVAMGVAILFALLTNLYQGYHCILLCFLLYLAKKKENLRPVCTTIAYSLYLVLQLGSYGLINSIGVMAVILLVEWVLMTRDKFQKKSSKVQLKICKWIYPVHMLVLIGIRLIITW